MCSAAIGDVIATTRTRELGKIISGGASLLLLAASTGLYVYVAAKEGHVNDSVVLTSSLWIFAASTLSCGVCVAVK